MQDKYQLLKQHFEEIVALTDEEWNFIAPHFEPSSATVSFQFSNVFSLI